MLKEENHFYPYGLLMEGITPVVAANGSINKYKFSDKELQLELGLNQYDFSARFYDPAIGRFNVIDPFADFAGDFTSYRYAFDNPVSFTDPSGLWEEDNEYDYDYEGGNRNIPGEPKTSWDISSGVFENKTDVEKTNPIGAHIDVPEREMEIMENMDGAAGTQSTTSTSDWNDEYNDRETDDGDLDEEIVDDIEDEIANTEGDWTRGAQTASFGLGFSSIYEDAAKSGLNYTPKYAIRQTAQTIAAEAQGLKALRGIQNTAKGLGILGNAICIGTAGYQLITNPTAGNSTRLAVQGLAVGALAIPVAGWGISLGIGIADYVWGDSFYLWIDK